MLSSFSIWFFVLAFTAAEAPQQSFGKYGMTDSQQTFDLVSFLEIISKENDTKIIEMITVNQQGTFEFGSLVGTRLEIDQEKKRKSYFFEIENKCIYLFSLQVPNKRQWDLDQKYIPTRGFFFVGYKNYWNKFKVKARVDGKNCVRNILLIK